MQSILHWSENARLVLPVEGIGTRSRRLRLDRSCLLAPERESTCGAGSRPARPAPAAPSRPRRETGGRWRVPAVPCAPRVSAG